MPDYGLDWWRSIAERVGRRVVVPGVAFLEQTVPIASLGDRPAGDQVPAGLVVDDVLARSVVGDVVAFIELNDKVLCGDHDGIITGDHYLETPADCHLFVVPRAKPRSHNAPYKQEYETQADCMVISPGFTIEI